MLGLDEDAYMKYNGKYIAYIIETLNSQLSPRYLITLVAQGMELCGNKVQFFTMPI